MPVTPSHAETATWFDLITASNEPLLFLTNDLRIVAASDSFCRAFQFEPASIAHRRLSEIGSGEWGMPNLIVRLTATASGRAEIIAYEIDLDREGRDRRHLVVNARKLNDGASVRLLVAIADVTEIRAEARLKDELIHEKTILLQEVQHRIANSLQLIAGFLDQSARKAHSEEARERLQDAHQRIMSIAAVQRHLALLDTRTLVLRPYLSQLCESLSASMVHDPAILSIESHVDESLLDANKAVGLGLIVTELVINALKHAFSAQRRGRIDVSYHTEWPAWTLSVRDNGVGITIGHAKPKAGLGAGIVEALAKHLHADVSITCSNPGTTVTVSGVGDSPREAKIIRLGREN